MTGQPLEPDQQEILRLVVTEACVDMFTSGGWAVRVLDLDGPVAIQKHDIAGFIGFAGRVQGSLTICGPWKLFRSTYPLGDNPRGLSKAELFDWTGEMANQLLGRVKMRFCERGQDFEASTPSAIEGRELTRRFPGRAGVQELDLAVGGDVMSVCFEVTPPADGKLFPGVAEAITMCGPGDVLMF